MKQNNEITYIRTDNLFDDSCAIIEAARMSAFRAVNVAMVQRNWLLGKRIAEEELEGKERAEYGAEVINKLSKQLTGLYGSGFTKSNLYQFVQFYKYFPEIFHTVCGKSVLLTWSHYRTLLQVFDTEARNWYARETAEQTWSVRTLQRYSKQISTNH